MEPKKVGRALGVGVRVASKMVRQRVAASQVSSDPPATETEAKRAVPSLVGERAATAKRGIKAFGQGVFGPFRHAGGVLWLELTGLFFALFALFFMENVYRVRGSWRQGPDHLHLLLYLALAVGFAWFSFSSFQRAYRKNRRGQASG